MHPQIIRDRPGKCPICGMRLEEVVQPAPEINDLVLTETQMKLANVTIRPVAVQELGQTHLLNARLVENQNLRKVVASRLSGRIEKLYTKETGRKIRKGESLYALYSETLMTLQREYLLALEQYAEFGTANSRYESFLNASRRKLALYGITEDQIENLGQTKAPNWVMTFLSPVDGIITEILAGEGQYVSEGTPLFRITSLKSLWVEAELYPYETPLANIGDNVLVRIGDGERATLQTKIDFLGSELGPNSQVVFMRASIPNDDLALKPGMYAQVLFYRKSTSALTVPSDAVIREARGAHVYVRKGKNRFVPRMVTTGIEEFDATEIIDGLTKGDTVVVTGAYLLYSEIILKKGKTPMGGHLH